MNRAAHQAVATDSPTLLRAPLLSEPALRARHLRGALSLDPPRDATRAFVHALRAHLHRALDTDHPPRAQHALSPADHFARITALRASLLHDPRVLSLTRDVLAAFHVDLDATYFDPPRLRAIPSGGHRNPRARAAYLPHRDTWFANPPAQINWWIALYDVPASASFALYPRHFRRPIANSSHAFDYDHFLALGGFQSPNPHKHHPTNTAPITGPALRFAAPCASLLRFAGSHLHGTAPHDTGVTRFSAEFRVVNLRDLHHRDPARDDRSRGSTLGEYLHARTLTPFALR